MKLSKTCLLTRLVSLEVDVPTLIVSKDPIIRYGGVYTLALAYAGTANNNAIRQLLHIAVSDTSDDVRRAAVTSLAFLLFKNPTQVPRMVQLLSESYNPHVRYSHFFRSRVNFVYNSSQLWRNFGLGYFLCGYRVSSEKHLALICWL